MNVDDANEYIVLPTFDDNQHQLYKLIYHLNVLFVYICFVKKKKKRKKKSKKKESIPWREVFIYM